jgi:hypothetical protein
VEIPYCRPEHGVVFLCIRQLLLQVVNLALQVLQALRVTGIQLELSRGLLLRSSLSFSAPSCHCLVPRIIAAMAFRTSSGI